MYMKFDWYKKISSFGVELEKAEQSLSENRKLAGFVALIMLVFMMLAGLASFFIAVKSPEKVMVPDVVGKELTGALQEMQVKELYPKIRLRYSKSPEDKGTVLEQSPAGGTIVKAGRRINLTVSQGVILDRVEDYTGMKIDDLRIQLQTLFAASSVQMIKVPDLPIYKQDESEASTILEQNPPANTNLTSPITLQLVVSSGPGRREIPIPNLKGLSLNDILLQISKSSLIFDFTAQLPQEGQAAGTVISQKWPEGKTSTSAYSRIEVVIALPDKIHNNLIYGLIDERLPPYPIPLEAELKAEPVQGNPYRIAAFKHTGNRLTIPYAVPRKTRLILTVAGKEIKRFIAE